MLHAPDGSIHSPVFARRYSKKGRAQMFTWICPTCGREVPPSYTECPDCTAKAAEPQPAAAPPDPHAPQTPAAPPVQTRPYTPPPPAAPRSGIPTWALTILFAFAIFGVVAGVY